MTNNLNSYWEPQISHCSDNGCDPILNLKLNGPYMMSTNTAMVYCTWLYLRALLKTAVLVPNSPTPRVSSIILLLLLITPSVSWVALRAWIAAPKLSVIPWKGENRASQSKSEEQTFPRETTIVNMLHLFVFKPKSCLNLISNRCDNGRKQYLA